MVALFMMALVFSGCSRYAPTTPPPSKNRILQITFNTAAQIDPSLYYYFVLETSNPLSVDGPLRYISGPEAAKNWSYYIRLYNNTLTERLMTTGTEVDAEPTLFNSLSPRFYYVSVNGNTVTLRMYIDKLVPVGSRIALNLITSDAPLTLSLTETTVALDYFIVTRVDMTTSTNIATDSTQYSLASSHTVADATESAAEIVSWTAAVYEM